MFYDGLTTVTSDDNEIKYKSRKDNNPRYYAKKAGYHLYDMIGQFEEELDDEFVEEVEELISDINKL